MSSLQEILDRHIDEPVFELPPIPEALPPTHLTDLDALRSLAFGPGLTPKPCRFMQETLVYLFYGGVFYRKHGEATNNAAEYPVAFLFRTSLLNQASCYYPFDTGALLSGRYKGRFASEIRSEYARYRLDGRGDSNVPRRLVQHFFLTNRKYATGVVNPACGDLADPFPLLTRFLSSDQTPHADQRQFRIECQYGSNISFDELIWIAYPEPHADVYMPIHERIDGTKPERYGYDIFRNMVPSEMAMHLQMEAHKFMKNHLGLFSNEEAD